jgi:hypothetical protein
MERGKVRNSKKGSRERQGRPLKVCRIDRRGNLDENILIRSSTFNQNSEKQTVGGRSAKVADWMVTGADCAR